MGQNKEERVRNCIKHEGFESVCFMWVVGRHFHHLTTPHLPPLFSSMSTALLNGMTMVRFSKWGPCTGSSTTGWVPFHPPCQELQSDAVPTGCKSRPEVNHSNSANNRPVGRPDGRFPTLYIRSLLLGFTTRTPYCL